MKFFLCLIHLQNQCKLHIPLFHKVLFQRDYKFLMQFLITNRQVIILQYTLNVWIWHLAIHIVDVCIMNLLMWLVRCRLMHLQDCSYIGKNLKHLSIWEAEVSGTACFLMKYFYGNWSCFVVMAKSTSFPNL